MEGVGRRVWILGTVVGLNGPRNKTHWFRIFMVLIVLTVVVVVRQIFEPVNKNKGLIVTSVEFASYNLHLPATYCCLVVTNLKHQDIEDFMTSSTTINKQMASLGYTTSYKSTKRLLRILTSFLLFKTLLQQVPFCTKGFWTTIDFLDYVAFNIPLVITHVLLLQWTIYLSILRLHFQTLNSLLKTLRYSKCWIVGDFRKSKHLPYSTIRSCASIYDSLCIQAEKLNTAFAWQILLLIPTFFVSVIFTSFQTCRMIKKLTDFDCFWVVFGALYFVMFLELVVPCVAVEKESKKFVATLHKIHGIDDAVNSLILQTYYQNIEFGACGVFPLDATLIYTVLGSLTTYLVILLQFDL